MKNLLNITIVISLLLIACEPQDNNFGEVQTKFCGCDEPLKDLKWLNNMIVKGEAGDERFHGGIWLIKYEDNDVIFTNMSVDPPNNTMRQTTFDCNGNRPHPKLSIEDIQTIVQICRIDGREPDYLTPILNN